MARYPVNIHDVQFHTLCSHTFPTTDIILLTHAMCMHVYAMHTVCWYSTEGLDNFAVILFSLCLRIGVVLINYEDVVG